MPPKTYISSVFYPAGDDGSVARTGIAIPLPETPDGVVDRLLKIARQTQSRITFICDTPDQVIWSHERVAQKAPGHILKFTHFAPDPLSSEPEALH